MNIYWTFVVVITVALFAGGEAYALVYHRQTFSRYVWDLSKAWPPLPWVVGLATGFIASHFWWGGSLICY